MVFTKNEVALCAPSKKVFQNAKLKNTKLSVSCKGVFLMGKIPQRYVCVSTTMQIYKLGIEQVLRAMGG